MMPPAMRKLARLMPRPLSNASPNSANTNRISADTPTARIAIARFCSAEALADRPA